MRNVGTCRPDAKGNGRVGSPHEHQSTEAGHRGGVTRSSDEAGETRSSEGVTSSSAALRSTAMREEPQSGAKPFQIPKRLVWEAYKQVKANQGAAGVDAESIEAFERHRNGNLYRLWNRMSSGTYFLSATSARSDHPETGWRGEEARNSDRHRSDCPDGREALPRAACRAAL